jgi:DNA-binding PadR family transcriptional regulator
MNTSSKLLIEEPPLQVLPTLAKKIGLNESIVLQQIKFWLYGGSGIIEDGRQWIYNTYQEWKIQFPFWSESTIRRMLTTLKSKGLIDVKQLGKGTWDRTNYYAINYDKLNELLSQNDSIDEVIDDQQDEQIDKVNLNTSIGLSCTPLNNTESLSENKDKDLKNYVFNNKAIKNVQDDESSLHVKKIVDHFYDTLKTMGIQKNKSWYGKQVGVVKVLLKKYAFEEIVAVIDWALADSWWAGVFNSLELFDNALQKMKGCVKNGRTGSTGGNTQDVHGGRYTDPGYYDEPEYEELIKRQKERFGV